MAPGTASNPGKAGWAWACGAMALSKAAFILNIGGFSDAVFQVVAACLREDPSRFVAEVESMTL